MYKIMVVDDEPIVRLALKSLINWKSCGFMLDLEAANGKQALRLLEENPDIDIVITDINMPVMGGLELISTINKQGIIPGIVVLSTYNDYNLVRQAFKLGAMDYILKTDMEPESILEILKDVVSRADVGNKDTGVTNTEGVLKLDMEYLKKKFLRDLIEQNEITGAEAMVKDYGLRLGRRNLAACFLWVDDYQAASERYDNKTLKSFIASIYNAISQVLCQTGYGEAIHISPQEYLVLLSFDDSSENIIRFRINEILGMIRQSLLNHLNINVSVGVSRVKDGFENIRELYMQSEANARMRFVLGKDRIIFPEDLANMPESMESSIISMENRFIQAIKEADREKALEELLILFSNIRRAESCEIDKVHAYYMELIFVIIKTLNELGDDTVDVFGDETDFYEIIKRFETIEEIDLWIRDMILHIIDYTQEKRATGVNSTMSRAMESIRENYRHDITLKMTADYVGLSESQFGHIFTKDTGETFTDYLTNIRIEKARNLLSTTNMKIYEVCGEVGYSSVEHFSRTFKKVTGESPNSYRRHNSWH